MAKSPIQVGRSLPLGELRLKQMSENALASEKRRNISDKETSSKESFPQDERVMDRLWVRMTEIFGHKWVSQYGDEPLETWAKRLGALSKEEIAVGVNACANSNLQWPPSLPDFCGMCKPDPASLGLPDSTSAFLEAMRNSHAPGTYFFSHEAVRLAGAAVGWYDMQACIPSEEVLRKRFDSFYAALVGKIQRGEDLVAPMQAIGSDREKDPSDLANEEAEHRLNERIREQGLADKTPAELRAEMLAKLKIKRVTDQ